MDTLRFELVGISRASAASLAQVYFDFIVSGHSLRHLLELEQAHQTGVFYPTRPVSALELEIKLFLGAGKAASTPERTRFYVCAECGDLACGAVTASIERLDSVVIWRDFRWDFGAEEEEPDSANDEHIGPFVFEKAEYERAFAGLKEQLPG